MTMLVRLKNVLCVTYIIAERSHNERSWTAWFASMVRQQFRRGIRQSGRMNDQRYRRQAVELSRK